MRLSSEAEAQFFRRATLARLEPALSKRLHEQVRSKSHDVTMRTTLSDGDAAITGLLYKNTHFSRRASVENEPSFRFFFRARFRAKACFTRRFSPGFK